MSARLLGQITVVAKSSGRASGQMARKGFRKEMQRWAGGGLRWRQNEIHSNERENRSCICELTLATNAVDCCGL